MITKMSDTSEETNQNEQRQGDSNNINSNSSSNNKEECNNGSVCRDFARGICDRKFCKFKHEPDTKMLNFCHDFQNHICPRPNCKFIHCSPEDELEYKATGVMSSHILVEATRKNQLPGTKAICNQFRKGLCRRTSCKYRHLTKEEEDSEIIELIQNNASSRKNVVCVNGPMTESPLGTLSPLNGLHMRNNITVEDYEECGIPLPKRRLIQSQEPEFMGNGDLHSVENIVRPVFKGYYAGTPPPPMLNRIDARTLMLEEENTLLHKEIAQLKRQVSDLTATNEFLLDQNANLRVSQKQRRNEEAAAAAAVVQQQQQQQQQHNVAMQPAVTITNTSNAPQVIRTVTASVATVPVSLATVSTCNPVSVSIAGVPATVSMAQPAQILAPSQQILVTTNPSTQLAIANSSQAQQLAIAQQNLANNLAAAQQAAQQHQQQAPQLTSSQAQQLALAATTTQQLALASTPQPQQLTLTNAGQQQQQQHQQLNQQLANHQQAQQVAAAAQQLANQQLTSQAQQLAANMAAANTQQQLTNQQAQQLALVSSTSQQLAASQQAAAQQLANIAAAATTQQQLTLSGTNQQLLVTAQQNLNAAVNQQQQQQQQQHQQMEMHRNNQLNAIATSQAIAMSNATQPMVSYPIMTQSINHALTH